MDDKKHTCTECGCKHKHNEHKHNHDENCEHKECKHKKCRACEAITLKVEKEESKEKEYSESQRSKECHKHHDHMNHEHKEKNKFTKWMLKAFNFLGWIDDSKEMEHHNHQNNDGHHHHEADTINTKLWILITGLIFAAFGISLMIASIWVDGIANSNWYIILGLVMGTIMFLLMGVPFCIGSTKSLMKKEIAEDTLVAISTTSAYVFSLVSAIIFFSGGTLFHGMTFFFEALEILAIIYLGRYIEHWLTTKVTKEMNSLDTLKAKNAIVIRNGKEIEVDVNDLVIGDILIVKPGSIVPVDGIVIEGKTTIDESLLTGESLPVAKTVNSVVFAGTISSNGLIKVEATKVIGDSFISKIIEGVAKAQEAKPNTQRLADKIAGVLVPVVLGISLLVFLILGFFASYMPWYNTDVASGGRNSWDIAITAMMTIMVIACPCSFAMITPMGVLAGSTSAKREGVLFNSKNTFEIIKQIDLICFDKTGTLTEGKFKVVETTIPKEWMQEVINIENNSNHPLAYSIVKHFSDYTPQYIKTEEVIGKGVKSDKVYIGSHKFVKELHKDFDEDEAIINKRVKGSVIIYAFNEKEILGYIELKDKIKDTSLRTISMLRKMGIQVAMITGDQKHTAISIASQLGIDKEYVFAEVEPEDKAKIVKDLQDKGKHVAFVGDGINDSVALVQSHLGIAVAEGSDAAIEAADIILNKNDMELVAYAMHLSRKTLFNIKRGFIIAVAYNVIAVPIAATGFFPPVLGAVSMIFNDSVAMVNAMTLLGVTNNSYKHKWNKK